MQQLLLALLSVPDKSIIQAPAPALLDNAELAQMLAPVEAEIRDAAMDTLYSVSTDAWKDLEQQTLNAGDTMAQQLWAALGENVRKAEQILGVIYHNSQRDTSHDSL